LFPPYIIDVHAHYGEWFSPIYASKTSDIMSMMRRYNIKYVILSSSKAITYDMIEGNNELSKILDYDEGLLGYVYVNPNYPELSKAEIRKYLGNPLFKGVGEIHPEYSGIPLNSKSLISIIEEAANYNKPMLIHTYSREHISHIAELANKFPDTIFIAAHMGGSARFGTGLSWKSAIAAAKEHSNLYLEICQTTLERGKIEEAVDAIGADKILFGSDLTLLNPAHAIGMIIEADISKSDKEKIFYLNAERIFKL